MKITEDKAKELHARNCTIAIDDGDGILVDYSQWRDKLSWEEIEKLYGEKWECCTYHAHMISGNKYF